MGSSYRFLGRLREDRALHTIKLSPAIALLLLSCTEVGRTEDRAEVSDLSAVETYSVRLEEPPGDPVGRVADLLVVDGRVILVDGLQANIKLFSLDGAFVEAWGRPGDGPGEFRFPAAAEMLGDTLLFLDPAKSRVSLFDAAGAYISEWAIPGTFIAGLSSRTTPEPTKIALASKTSSPQPLEARAFNEILTLGEEGNTEIAFGRLAPPRSAVQSAFQTVFLAASDEFIVYGSMDSDRLRVYTWEGAFIAQVDAGGPTYEAIDWPHAPSGDVELWEWLSGNELLTKIIWVGDQRFLARFETVGEDNGYRYSLASVEAVDSRWLGSTGKVGIAIESWDGNSLWGYRWSQDGAIDLIQAELEEATNTARR